MYTASASNGWRNLKLRPSATSTPWSTAPRRDRAVRHRAVRRATAATGSRLHPRRRDQPKYVEGGRSSWASGAAAGLERHAAALPPIPAARATPRRRTGCPQHARRWRPAPPEARIRRCGRRECSWSASASGPNSTTRAGERRKPSDSRATGSARHGSAARQVATPAPARLRRCGPGRRRGRASTRRPNEHPPTRVVQGDRCSLRQQRQRRLEHVQLRPLHLTERVAERTHTSTKGWNGNSTPTRSIDRPSSTSKPLAPAADATSAASRDLPMPASPVTSTVAPRPVAAR